MTKSLSAHAQNGGVTTAGMAVGAALRLLARKGLQFPSFKSKNILVRLEFEIKLEPLLLSCPAARWASIWKKFKKGRYSNFRALCHSFCDQSLEF